MDPQRIHLTIACLGRIIKTKICGQGDQTAAHLFAECTDAKSRAMRTMGFVTNGDVAKGLSDFKKAPWMARALINSGWLPQFRVFNELRQEDTTPTEEESACASPTAIADPNPGPDAGAGPALRRGARRRLLILSHRRHAFTTFIFPIFFNSFKPGLRV